MFFGRNINLCIFHIYAWQVKCVWKMWKLLTRISTVTTATRKNSNAHNNCFLISMGGGCVRTRALYVDLE